MGAKKASASALLFIATQIRVLISYLILLQSITEIFLI
jgi:hypothetical protein